MVYSMYIAHRLVRIIPYCMEEIKTQESVEFTEAKTEPVKVKKVYEKGKLGYKYGLAKNAEIAERKMGRPPMFATPQKLQEKVDDYFAVIDHEERPMTFAGLAGHLDCDPQTLARYAMLAEFSPVLQNAYRRIKTSMEERMLTHKGNPAGLIFLAKNYGYKDTQEIKHTHQSINSVLGTVVGEDVFEGQIIEEESEVDEIDDIV